MGNLEAPINLTPLIGCLWIVGEAREYPERTHTNKGIKCNQHTERPWLNGGFEPEPFCYEATALTNTLHIQLLTRPDPA